MTPKPLLLLALGLATSLPALACTTCNDKAQAAAPAAAAAAPGGDALTVVRDAASGQLRAPTPEELANLIRQQAAQQRAARPAITLAAPTTPMLRRAPNGAVNVRLTPEFSSHAVMVRLPDGTLAERCVHAPDAASALAQAKSALAPVAQTAELQ